MAAAAASRRELSVFCEAVWEEAAEADEAGAQPAP
jgi:hypothetical protein